MVKAEKYCPASDLHGQTFTDEELRKPTQEEIDECTARTAAALNLGQSDSSLFKNNPKLAQPTVHEPTFVRYTPSQSTGLNNSGAQERIIRIQEIQQDPMEPSRFRLQKDARRPPSPPTTILRSPSRKATAEELEAWKIPVAVSNYHNRKGFVIDLDKRIGLDGKQLQTRQISDKFAHLAEALYVTERAARTEVELRASMMQRLEEKKRDAEDRLLQERAQQARLGLNADAASAHGVGVDDAERQRAILRQEREKELERSFRLQQHAHSEGRAARAEAMGRDREISERIALGETAKASGGARFDERLFHRGDGGVAAGLGGEDANNFYDTALFSDKNDRNMYTYRGAGDSDSAVGALQTGAAKQWEDASGRTMGAPREGPVQFEKAGAEGVDAVEAMRERVRERTEGEVDEEEQAWKRRRGNQ